MKHPYWKQFFNQVFKALSIVTQSKMPQFICQVLFVLAISGYVMTDAKAVVLFDSGEPDFAGFTPSDFDFSGPFPSQAADKFTLQSNSILREFKWWGIYWSPNSDNIAPVSDDFSVRLFNIGNNDLPNIDPTIVFSSLSIERTDTGVDLGNSDVYMYSMMFPDIQFATGDYAISFVNDTSGDTNDDWRWLTSCDLCGSAYVRDGNMSNWALASNDLAFQVFGVVPEPSSLLLLATGCGVFFYSRRRNRGSVAKFATEPAGLCPSSEQPRAHIHGQ